MIDLYSSPTPNGWKVAMALEELSLPYTVNYIDLAAGDQHKPEFLAMNPNGRIPVIVDHEADDLVIFDSNAILFYLAEKTGKLLPKEGFARAEVMQWLMFQTGHVGPMLGQTHHFVKFNPGKAPYAEERYSKENARLYEVLENRLQERDFICDDYSIVDIATWPWISRYEFQQMNLSDYPHLKTWYLRIAERPAVKRGYAVPRNLSVPIPG